MDSFTRYAIGQADPFLKSVLPFVTHNWPGLIAAAALCKVSLFYIRRSAFPPGPLPFPYIGNLPALMRVGGSFYQAAEMWRPIHGDIFTVWIGERPWIFINSLDAILACNTIALQNDFGGRVRTNTGDVQMQGNVGVIFSDLGSAQQTLRSIAQQAVRKYLKSRNPRQQIITDIVDNFLDQEQNKFIESKNIAEELVQCLSTVTMFGAELEPEKQKELREAHRALEINCPSGLPSDVIPIFKYLLWKRERAGLAAFYRYNAIARELCHQSAEISATKFSDEIDCVMDAVVQAVNATRSRERDDILTRENVSQIVFDLFEAGSQTSVITLNWALLKLASDQELQSILYEEIIAHIEGTGTLPEKKEKTTLPRLQSFLKEVMRFWPAAPFGLPRKLSKATLIGNRLLPANSTILFNLYRANRDPSYWTAGDVFKPERFLEQDGTFDDRHHKGLLTFGVGARACVGNVLAVDNLFFMLARIIHKCKILPPKSGIILDPFPAALMLDAKIQEIKLETRD